MKARLYKYIYIIAIAAASICLGCLVALKIRTTTNTQRTQIRRCNRFIALILVNIVRSFLTLSSICFSATAGPLDAEVSLTGTSIHTAQATNTKGNPMTYSLAAVAPTLPNNNPWFDVNYGKKTNHTFVLLWRCPNLLA